MDPDTVLNALRQLTSRTEETGRDPQADWSDLATEALAGVEALDTWLARGGALPAAWTTHR